MKKLLFIILLLPIMAWSQGRVTLEDNNPPVFKNWILRGDTLIPIIKEKQLDEQYIDWCNADSNKVLIGYEFVLEEYISGRLSYTVYKLEHAKNRNHLKYYDNIDWDDPETVYYYWEKQQKQDNPQYFIHQDYKRAVPIKDRTEPTFEGFVKWKKKYNKN